MPIGPARIVLALVLAVAPGLAIVACGDEQPDVRRLSWAPPALERPETIRVTPERTELDLEPERDYVVELPGEPLRAPNGLSITGGRNVVLIGGEIEVPTTTADALEDSGRGLYLVSQTGTVHVEGLRLTGDGLTEGIDLAQPLGATVQLQSIRMDELFYPPELDSHPDVVQTWAGPSELRIDGLTATTNYQGLFLHPQEREKTVVRSFDIRNVNIAGAGRAAYLLWQATPFEKQSSEVWVKGAPGRPAEQLMWPKPEAWPGVRTGDPPGGDFVPPEASGLGYESPGYADG
jgi:hypothetical protein